LVKRKASGSKKSSGAGARGSAPKTMEELLKKHNSEIRGLKAGEKITATVIEITKSGVVLDVGRKSEGMVTGECFDEVRDYVKTLKKGEKVSALVLEAEGRDGLPVLSLRHAAQNSVWDRLSEAKKKGKTVSVMGKSVGDSGVAVEFENVFGFVPLSQIGKEALRDPQKLVGNRFNVKVIDLNRGNKRVIFSERAVSEASDVKLEMKAMKKISEGDVFEGEVAQITGFGAFVRIWVEVGGKKIPIEGLVHISELSWQKIGKVGDMLAAGDKVNVVVISVDDGKIALSIKKAQKDPWDEVEKKYKTDMKIDGKIIRKSGFGLFVELEPGIEGLVHITKIPPGSNYNKGDIVKVYVEEVNKEGRKISLGLVLTAKPVGYK